jgi:hypothetical protein
MAEKHNLAEPKVKIRRAPRSDEHETDGPTRYYSSNAIDLSPYIRAVYKRWQAVALATIAAAAMTALVTGFIFPRSYQATAVIRPISTPAVESRIAGAIGGLGGGFMGGLGSLAASFGGGGSNDAEEYIAILKGFEFNVSVVKHHHHLEGLLRPGRLSLLLAPNRPDPEWMWYRALQKQFECEYSFTTGNITLDFVARDRIDAEQVLGYYISDLRDLLRAREINGATAAIESLEDEAQTTPDALLRAELYQLMAKQLQRKKMAQVEADFAFRVLDPPAASDKHYRPRVLLDCLIVAFLTMLMLSAGIMLRDALNDRLATHSANSSDS